MDETTRRNLLRTAAVAGTAAAVGTASAAPAVASGDGRRPLASHTQPEDHHWTEEERKDRVRVLKAGFTEDEADCWLLLVRAVGAFFALPEQHPSDLAEVAEATHVIQNKLLSRPTYRVYRKAAEEDGTLPKMA